MAYNHKAWRIAKKHADRGTHLPFGIGHYLGLTGPCCDVCQRIYDAVVEVYSVAFADEFTKGYNEGLEAGRKGDNPVFDGTDFAHPTWWRGHECSFTRSCQEINNILDGTKANVGTASNPWQALRQRLYDIRAMLGIAERVMRTIPDCLNRRQWYSIRGEYCKGVKRMANESIQGRDLGDEHEEKK